VLWNDYKAALAIAYVVGADFVRIPVFTEAVVTSAGIIEGTSYDVISYRDHIRSRARILADVHVKHASILSPRAIEDSGREALHYGADQIIITGNRTGDPPDFGELRRICAAVGRERIIIGSGMTTESIRHFTPYTTSAIVGTAFEKNGRVQAELVKKLVDAVRE
jgi:membrane complex biogenesis BtpA family protein